MKKVIITGAGGFIGHSLTRYLLSQGIEVFGIDISNNRLNNINSKLFHYIQASFKDYSNLSSMIKDRDFDTFYHFAWDGVFGEPFKNHHLQLSNAAYAADAIYEAKKLNCKKFVLAGTMNQYETLNYINKDNIKPRYTCIYSTSKIAADMICKTIAYNIDIQYNLGLIAMAYGENNYSMMIPNIVMQNLNDGISPRLIEGNNLYDLMYIKDIVNAFYCIGEKGKNQRNYYIGHKIEELKTFKEWMIDIRNIINPNIKLKFGEYPDSTEFDYSNINTHSLYDDTNFTIHSNFEESILITSSWLKENKK